MEYKEKSTPKPEVPVKPELHPELPEGVPHIGVYPSIYKKVVLEDKPTVVVSPPKEGEATVVVVTPNEGRSSKKIVNRP